MPNHNKTNTKIKTTHFNDDDEFIQQENIHVKHKMHTHKHIDTLHKQTHRSTCHITHQFSMHTLQHTNTKICSEYSTDTWTHKAQHIYWCAHRHIDITEEDIRVNTYRHTHTCNRLRPRTYNGWCVCICVWMYACNCNTEDAKVNTEDTQLKLYL